MKQDPQVKQRLFPEVSLTLSPWYTSHLLLLLLLLQNADLKKQLHELQAKITALSEKQVQLTERF